ncbi:RNA polymerase sigma factor SigJ [Planctomicrobium sp. SH664]|uniref:RNA polymerase sigma factor SigJ n=1 Tax=Planctomicrobium sp. SH664 TaxID=3448125 RepID=UPI003F5B86E2
MKDYNFQEFRSRMMSVAYRMLGSVADAEDVVQDAFLRLQLAGEVTSPEGFLVTTTTRRCIDYLRASQHRKSYIGPWVPEPVDTKDCQPLATLGESLTQAFLLLLERLSPVERAAFLLRTVFGYEYAEIAAIVDRSEAHVRKIVSRANLRVTQDRPRFCSTSPQADELADRFLSACRSGDVKAIEQLFTENVEVHSDGGGKVSAARVVIHGRERAARFLAGVFSRKRRHCAMTITKVNGEPGAFLSDRGTVVLVASLHLEAGVRAVYLTNNPDKLSRWSVARIQ